MNVQRASLAISKRARETREAYESSGQRQYANILVYGDFGTGKTQLISTAPRPIWIHSFDPGGTKTAALQPLIDSGDCIVDSRFEDVQGDDWKNPRVWAEWEKELDAMMKEDLFSSIGTFAIDSFTKLADALMNELMKRNGHRGKTPQIQDYMLQQMSGVETVSRLASLPCHTIITGHLQRDKNEITGRIETSMLLYGKMADKIPLCLDEKFLTISKDGKTGAEYFIQTQNDGEYRASTRMGGGIFTKYEEPNLRRLLKLAGRSHEDKPPFDFESEKEKEE